MTVDTGSTTKSIKNPVLGGGSNTNYNTAAKDISDTLSYASKSAYVARSKLNRTKSAVPSQRSGM